MADYKSTSDNFGIVRTLDSASIPPDPGNKDWQAYQAWLALGNTPDPYVTPAPVIASVTQKQARLALLGAGLLDQVNAAVNAVGGAVLITWEYSDVISRTDPLIASVGTALGLTSAQIDALFRTASTL